MNVDWQMLITAERDGHFGLRAKPASAMRGTKKSDTVTKGAD